MNSGPDSTPPRLSAAFRPDTLALTALLAVLSALGPLSTDMYLPSLPAIARYFDVGAGEAQLTLSGYLIGFAAGQVVYGPWSDRRGRRVVILAGLSLYALASLAAAAAPDLPLLIAARTLQGFGAAAPLVLARAVVRDLYTGARAGKELARMGTIMGLVPALAPLAGAVLEVAFGWRASFFVALGASLFLAALVYGRLPETLAARLATPFAPRDLARDFGALVRDTRFWPFAFLAGVTYCGLFAFISGSSFVLQGRFGLGELAFAASFGAVVLGYISGTLLAPRLVAARGMAGAMLLGSTCQAAGGLLMLILLASRGSSALEVTLPMALYAFGVGCTLPQAIAAAIMPFPERAGTASSLMGVLQMGSAAALGFSVGQALETNDLALPVAVAGAGLAALILALKVRHRVL